MSKKYITLAGCIIRDEKGRMLLLHRNTLQRKQWEIPGGKIDPGESAEQAAARELQEELGITVKITKSLGSKEFIDSGQIFHYTWFGADVMKGVVHILEPELFDEARYFSQEELSHAKDLSINVQNFLATQTVEMNNKKPRVSGEDQV